MGELTPDPNALETEIMRVAGAVLENYIGRLLTQKDVVVIVGDIINQANLEMVNSTEAGEILGVSRQRINQLWDRGKMPPAIGQLNKPTWRRDDIMSLAMKRQQTREKHSLGTSLFVRPSLPEQESIIYL